MEKRKGLGKADRAAFKKLAYQGEVRMDTYLNDLEHVKFQLEKAGTDGAQLYFMNTKTHRGHPMFMRAIGIPFNMLQKSPRLSEAGCFICWAMKRSIPQSMVRTNRERF